VPFLICRVFPLPKNVFYSLFRLKICNRIQNINCNEVHLLEYFIYNLHVYDVLCAITLVMAPRNDPGLDQPPLHKGGTSHLITTFGCGGKSSLISECRGDSN
jgi:hypothetical protein